MSRENIDVLRTALEGFNARDLDAMLALAHPGVEWHSTFAALGGAVYHGHSGVRNWHRDLQEVFSGAIRVEPESYFDLGEQVLSFLTLRGRGGQSGVEVAMPMAQVWRLRDGLIAYCKT